MFSVCSFKFFFIASQTLLHPNHWSCFPGTLIWDYCLLPWDGSKDTALVDSECCFQPDVQSLPSCPRLNSLLGLRMYPLPILGNVTHLLSFLHPHLLPLSWILHFHFNVLSLFCFLKKQCSLDSASSLSSCLHLSWAKLTFRKSWSVLFPWMLWALVSP